ncbi:hypothetical protein [Actinoplanes philippinensis]|uniref:hypothetical protein n=1 Tax=Actinoplanes philippinensis TaxID=35752 RepID=UPI0033C3CEB9
MTADPAGLTAVQSRKLRTAVTTVERCLGQWQPFVAAATAHELHLTVGATDGPPETTEGHQRVRVPHDLVDDPPSRLAAGILAIVVPAIVAHAENHPHEHPPSFWTNPDDRQPSAHDPEPGIQVDDLLDGDVLVIARHDGTPADADIRERALDSYLCDRLEAPGIAGRDGAYTTGSAVCLTLELLSGD